MPRYIDANLLKAEFTGNFTKAYAVSLIKSIIDQQPTADVQEVKHANWVHLGGDEWCCSCCGFGKHTEGYWENPTAKYCEKCGAEINGVEH